jgi:hypothetical protein
MKSVMPVTVSSEPMKTECEACAALREALRMCLGALCRYYHEELMRNESRELSVSELVQGGVVLRAEQALRQHCTCGHAAS